MTDSTIQRIVEYWIEHSECSPQSKDKVMKRLSNGKTEEHQIHYVFGTKLELYQNFLKDTHLKVSRPIFELHRPWYIREGKMDTCLCMTCENMAEAIKSINLPTNRHLLDQFIDTQYFEQRLIVLSFLQAIARYVVRTRRHKKDVAVMAEEERRQISSVKEDYKLLRKRKSITHYCSSYSRHDLVESMLCKDAIPKYCCEVPGLSAIGKQACYDMNEPCKCSSCGFRNKCFTISDLKALVICTTEHKANYHTSPLISSFTQEDGNRKSDYSMIGVMQSESLFRLWLSCDDENLIEEWKEEELSHQITYCVYEHSSYGNDAKSMYMDLVEKRCSPFKFLEYLETLIEKSCHHYCLNIRTKSNQKLQDYNQTPNQLFVTMDFSENLVYSGTEHKQVQGQYFRRDRSCTIFVVVLKALCKASWDLLDPLKKVELLSHLSEVSVEMIDENTGLTYFRIGIVQGTPIFNIEKNLYEVQIIHNTLNSELIVTYPINRIRVRKVLMIPHIVVSDTKYHDSRFVQDYLLNDLLGSNGPLTCNNLIPHALEINELHIRSDGAASHFKSVNTLYFLTELKQKFKARFNRVTWSFNAPGHGKGTWDGLGGSLKHRTKRYLIKTSASVTTAEQLYHIMLQLFDSAERKEFYQISKTHVIKRWHITYLPETNLQAIYPTVNEAGENLCNINAFGVGTRDLFSYEAIFQDCLLCSRYGCWCMYCTQRGQRVSAYFERNNQDELLHYASCCTHNNTSTVHWDSSFIFPMKFSDYQFKRRLLVKNNSTIIIRNYCENSINHGRTNLMVDDLIAYEHEVVNEKQNTLHYRIGRIMQIITSTSEENNKETLLTLRNIPESHGHVFKSANLFSTSKATSIRRTIEKSQIRHIINIESDMIKINETFKLKKSVDFLINKAMHVSLVDEA